MLPFLKNSLSYTSVVVPLSTGRVQELLAYDRSNACKVPIFGSNI